MQLDFFEVPSPCIGICQSDDKGYCKGCMRTRDERQSWITLDNDEKQKVIKRCVQRKRRKDGLVKTKAVEDAPEVSQPSLFDPPEKKSTLDTNTDFDFDDFEL
ncbi:DUF1289 domain-containing protein [Thalassotalea agarivorans]|uniref:DUF1289 domain-containing protein n=1 Tax=Thalassotalea agarivorans TaxID=349064 RepID=A0A1I0ADH8_THASX|nr:DUF1289 domain-containing protein [Thalassotalea agarivorans]SES91760.1 hypothetical protein SAMN05660429_00654 [Thalassotalea agarivorans]